MQKAKYDYIVEVFGEDEARRIVEQAKSADAVLTDLAEKYKNFMPSSDAQPKQKAAPAAPLTGQKLYESLFPDLYREPDPEPQIDYAEMFPGFFRDIKAERRAADAQATAGRAMFPTLFKSED